MRKLLFVYNANSGPLHTAFDIAHKLFSPSTYSCQLCQLTHGIFTEREDWKKFRETSDDELIFHHKDEFEALYNQDYEYPIVLEEIEGTLSVYLPTEQIRDMQDVGTLIEHLISKAAEAQ